MRKFDIATSILLFIGAINWGFIGLFDFNFILVFVENELAVRLIYTLIAVAAIYRAVYYKSVRTRWQEE
jgi:uncharacterized membrane protein YuzA (DUF378 family)